MANQQHIDWLLEGVESWNGRRERDDFVPDFEGADIRGAFRAAGKVDKNGRFNLSGVNLREANLKGANLRGADLSRADLQWANLGKADTKLASPSPALRRQVAFLLRVAPSAAATALHTASQIQLAVSEARMNAEDEPALFLQVATALKTLGNALKQADDKDIEIAKLEAIVAQQKAEIERLTGLIANMPSAQAQIIVAALGGAGATAITGAVGLMFGSDGANMINNLWQFFNSGGGLPTPQPQLPPTILT